MNAITVKCNNQTQMYSTSAGSNYGFDYILNNCQEILTQLKKKSSNRSNFSLDPEIDPFFKQPDQLPELRGTEKLFNIYHLLLDVAKKVRLGTFFHYQTPPKVRRILNSALKSDQKLRVFYGDTSTGRDWLEENDVIGTIGRSTGILQIPLLISEDECGGPGLLDHCIVRIIDVDTKEELYRHAKYQLPNLKITEIDSSVNKSLEGFSHSISDLTSGEASSFANCRTFGEACHLVAFLTGNSMTSTS